MMNSSLAVHQDTVFGNVIRFVEKPVVAFFRIILLVGVITVTSLVCCSCSSTQAVTQLVEHIQKDTIYLSNIQYDSIYIFQDKYVDRSRDTLYIKDKSIEYRYRLLKDTVRIVKRDSIPYEVTITEVKEITRPLTRFDHICRACFWFCLGGLLFKLIYLMKGFRKRY